MTELFKSPLFANRIIYFYLVTWTNPLCTWITLKGNLATLSAPSLTPLRTRVHDANDCARKIFNTQSLCSAKENQLFRTDVSALSNYISRLSFTPKTYWRLKRRELLPRLHAFRLAWVNLVFYFISVKIFNNQNLDNYFDLTVLQYWLLVFVHQYNYKNHIYCSTITRGKILQYYI